MTTSPPNPPRRIALRRWLPGCFINDNGHPIVNLDSVQFRIVEWADALIRHAMRKLNTGGKPADPCLDILLSRKDVVDLVDTLNEHLANTKE